LFSQQQKIHYGPYDHHQMAFFPTCMKRRNYIIDSKGGACWGWQLWSQTGEWAQKLIEFHFLFPMYFVAGKVYACVWCTEWKIL